ncbi:hypothetical protein JJB07_00660 [Tumebacillus sp. ITR2]|uniref:Metalloprotease TldD/E C-terminal domain-containing protein n=1 Tax=Tumebacillus amylolyticus TaxID=2801339 RepID=A0ABS1J4E1_9BACL|nr:metallopeptidase TldD-related protein [Tumebacillus amylolyticus]MBL0385142.1 hypothetical protein [Tumebacillus amylolyticus]
MGVDATLETCLLRLTSTLYDSRMNGLPVVEEQTLSAARCIKDGRLGVATAMSSLDQGLVKRAEEVVFGGVPVSPTFLHSHSFVQQPARLDHDQMKQWLAETQQKLAARYAGYVLTTRHVRRDMTLWHDQQETVALTQDFFEHHVHVKQTPDAKVNSSTSYTIDSLPELDELTRLELCLEDEVPATALDSGTYEVVFTPQAFDLLLNLWVPYLNPGVQSQLPVSALRLHQGERVASAGLTLDTNVSYRPAVDDEGVPLSETPLIEDGYFVSGFQDRLSAEQIGGALTGSGFRTTRPTPFSNFALPTSALPYLRVSGGQVSSAELVASVGRGLLIHELSPSYNRDYLFTSARIPVVEAYWVEDGKVIGKVPAKSVLFLDILPFFRSQLVLSRERKQLSSREVPWMYAPSVSLRSG